MNIGSNARAISRARCRRPDQPPRDGHFHVRRGPNRADRGRGPLSETFGYSTDLRSMTQGQGTFTLEFARYRRLPPASSAR